MAALTRNVCFCPARATPNAIYSWPWTFIGSIWPLADPGESIFFKAKTMNKECCINIKESSDCLRKKINYRISTSQLFQIYTPMYEGHHFLQRVISKLQHYCWISSQLLTISVGHAAFKKKVKSHKTPSCPLFRRPLFLSLRQAGAVFSVCKPLICKGMFPHNRGDHIVSFALTHRIKPSHLIRRVHTHPYNKTVTAASPKASLVRCPRGRDTLMQLDHRVSGEELVRILLHKHIVYQEGKVFERHVSTCCNTNKK